MRHRTRSTPATATSSIGRRARCDPAAGQRGSGCSDRARSGHGAFVVLLAVLAAAGGAVLALAGAITHRAAPGAWLVWMALLAAAVTAYRAAPHSRDTGPERGAGRGTFADGAGGHDRPGPRAAGRRCARLARRGGSRAALGAVAAAALLSGIGWLAAAGAAVLSGAPGAMPRWAQVIRALARSPQHSIDRFTGRGRDRAGVAVLDPDRRAAGRRPARRIRGAGVAVALAGQPRPAAGAPPATSAPNANRRPRGPTGPRPAT